MRVRAGPNPVPALEHARRHQKRALLLHILHAQALQKVDAARARRRVQGQQHACAASLYGQGQGQGQVFGLPAHAQVHAWVQAVAAGLREACVDVQRQAQGGEVVAHELRQRKRAAKARHAASQRGQGQQIGRKRRVQRQGRGGRYLGPGGRDDVLVALAAGGNLAEVQDLQDLVQGQGLACGGRRLGAEGQAQAFGIAPGGQGQGLGEERRGLGQELQARGHATAGLQPGGQATAARVHGRQARAQKRQHRVQVAQVQEFEVGAARELGAPGLAQRQRQQHVEGEGFLTGEDEHVLEAQGRVFGLALGLGAGELVGGPGQVRPGLVQGLDQFDQGIVQHHAGQAHGRAGNGGQHGQHACARKGARSLDVDVRRFGARDQRKGLVRGAPRLLRLQAEGVEHREELARQARVEVQVLGGQVKAQAHLLLQVAVEHLVALGRALHDAATAGDHGQELGVQVDDVFQGRSFWFGIGMVVEFVGAVGHGVSFLVWC